MNDQYNPELKLKRRQLSCGWSNIYVDHENEMFDSELKFTALRIYTLHIEMDK